MPDPKQAPDPQTLYNHLPPGPADAPVHVAPMRPPPVPGDAKPRSFGPPLRRPPKPEPHGGGWAGYPLWKNVLVVAAPLLALAAASTVAMWQNQRSGFLSCLAPDGEPVDALDVCADLERAHVVHSCAAGDPGGLGARASHVAKFAMFTDGKKGQIMSFSTCEAVDKTVREYDGYTYLAGRHQYASRRLRLFIQLNEKVDDDAARAMVDAAFNR